MTTEDTAAKKDIQKLQRAIVDGLEDVKGHDIQVFDTEKLSPLFERVIVASGTSNRQTKALAASVRDAVREAGFPKPRIEGEENGEWIIVDCGAAVAHIMQPTFRQYYRLEDLWGDKPVRIRFGAPKPVVSVDAPAKKAAVKKAAAKKVAAKQAPSKKVAAGRIATRGRTAAPVAPRPTAARKPAAARNAAPGSNEIAVKTTAPSKKAAPGKKAASAGKSLAPGKSAERTTAAAKSPSRSSAAKKART